MKEIDNQDKVEKRCSGSRTRRLSLTWELVEMQVLRAAESEPVGTGRGNLF